MIFKRLYNEKLAHASYLIGSSKTGEAAVVDPNRDFEQYLRAAREERLRITAVTETHIHADYLSGARELAKKTRAKLYLSDEGGRDWRYAFLREDGAVPLKDGDSFRVGEVRLDAVQTPGHTPEHLSFLITDESSSPQPLGVLTGDFVFVGDVGRPDLLEQAAGVSGTMEPAARELFRSLQAFKKKPDHLLIWPGHGAGSACGKALGALPVSSLGYERLSNWALRETDEAGFVREVLSGQPDPPPYFAVMKRLNRLGPPPLGEFKMPGRRSDARRIPELATNGAMVVDARDSDDYARGHVPGTLNIPGDKSFITWAGWLVPHGSEVILVAKDEREAEQAVRDLQLIGLDNVSYWFDEDSLRDYARRGELAVIPEVGAEELLRKRDEYLILDVRTEAEWEEEGHLVDARHIPLGHLTQRAQELPQDKRIAVHCEGGGRSPIAASVLRRLGFSEVVNVPQGFRELGRLDTKQRQRA